VSLPAAQQRVLDRMEGALQASEPHLASMFTIFARLTADEPVRSEPLARPTRRHLWLQHGTTLYAFVLVPVMFTMIIIGALLSGRVHSAGACAVGYSAGSGSPSGSGSPWISRPLCQLAGNAKAATSRAGLASCAARIPAIRFVTRSRSEQVIVPPEPASAAMGPPAVC
jgi:hypothetical protein